MKIGISKDTFFGAFLATRRAFFGSHGYEPYDFDHTVFRAIWNEIIAIERFRDMRMSNRVAPECQSGNLELTRRSTTWALWRSSGNINPNSASTCANSASERARYTCMPKSQRWFMTLFAKEVNETTSLQIRTDGAVVAWANNRLKSAIWVGFRPIILQSTSTIGQYILIQ